MVSIPSPQLDGRQTLARNVIAKTLGITRLSATKSVHGLSADDVERIIELAVSHHDDELVSFIRKLVPAEYQARKA